MQVGKILLEILAVIIVLSIASTVFLWYFRGVTGKNKK